MLNRARVIEQWEQQYKEVEGERNEVTAPDKTTPKANESSKSNTGASHEQRGSSQGRSIRCNSCHGCGHIAKYCRHRFEKSSEASGKSKGSSTPQGLTAELSDEQLEEELAKRRLIKER